MKAWVEMQCASALADKRNEIKVIFRVNLLGNLKYTNEHLGNFFNTARKGGGGKVMYLHSYHHI